jgi:hypothetical protein
LTRDFQADSQDEADYLLSKVTARYDEIEAEQQRLTVRFVIVYVCLKVFKLTHHWQLLLRSKV